MTRREKLNLGFELMHKEAMMGKLFGGIGKMLGKAAPGIGQAEGKMMGSAMSHAPIPTTPIPTTPMPAFTGNASMIPGAVQQGPLAGSNWLNNKMSLSNMQAAQRMQTTPVGVFNADPKNMEYMATYMPHLLGMSPH